MGPSGLIISIVVLIFLSTFFSLAETAIVSVPEEKIFKMEQDGIGRAKSAMKILANKEKIVSIALLCDNLVNIAASSLSAVFFAEQFGEFDEIGILLSTIMMTILVFVFGEVLPKMVALRRPTNITLMVAPIFLLLWKLLCPVVWIVNVMTSKIVSALNIRSEEETDNADNSILGAVEMYHQKGMLESDEKEMLSGVLHLDDIDMKDIMTHRSDMFAVDMNDDINTIIQQILSTTFTKVPVYDKSDDKIIGYLKVIDLMRELHKNNNDSTKIDLRSLLVKPWYLPGDSSIGKHLQEFKDKGNTIAFVVDEYGGLMGIVTLEDILEEIVGDINSDNSADPCVVIENENGSFTVKADMNLLDLNDKIQAKFEDKEVSTIGGFLLNKIEKIPSKGEKFDVDGYTFEILDATDTNIEKINITKIDSNVHISEQELNDKDNNVNEKTND